MKVITTNLLNYFWKNGVKPIKDAVGSKLDASKVANNLTTTVAGYALDARQGRELNNNKLSVTNVANNLATTQAGYALDARQGKALEDKIAALNGNLKRQYVQSGRAMTQNMNGYFRRIDIVFATAYKNVPIVVATPILPNTDATGSRLTCSISNPKQTGCGIFVADQNGSISNVSCEIEWIAVGEIN